MAGADFSLSGPPACVHPRYIVCMCRGQGLLGPASGGMGDRNLTPQIVIDETGMLDRLK